MRNVIFCIILLLIPSESHSTPSPCETITPIYDEISRIAKKEFKTIAPCGVKNRDEIKKFITHSIELRLPKNKLLFEGELLKLLQLIPQDYKYEKELISLYNQQVAGFYDPYSKSYNIADWIPETLHQSVALHELVHVLQDQYFDLLTFIDKDMTTDQSLARAAAIEGDATLIMQQALRNQNKSQSLLESDDIDQIADSIISQSKKDRSTSHIPRILKETLTFPYAYGLKYVFNKKKSHNNDMSFDGYLKNPPNSTTEIIYPPHVLSDFKPSIPLCPTFPDYKLVFKDTLGEFFYASSIEPEILKNPHSRNWNGDIYCVYAGKNGDMRTTIILEWPNAQTFNKIQEFLKRVSRKRGAKLYVQYPTLRLDYNY